MCYLSTYIYVIINIMSLFFAFSMAHSYQCSFQTRVLIIIISDRWLTHDAIVFKQTIASNRTHIHTHTHTHTHTRAYTSITHGVIDYRTKWRLVSYRTKQLRSFLFHYGKLQGRGVMHRHPDAISAFLRMHFVPFISHRSSYGCCTGCQPAEGR